jgi:uncharacterized repeat protein (TIGR02543 family)
MKRFKKLIFPLCLAMVLSLLSPAKVTYAGFGKEDDSSTELIDESYHGSHISDFSFQTFLTDIWLQSGSSVWWIVKGGVGTNGWTIKTPKGTKVTGSQTVPGNQYAGKFYVFYTEDPMYAETIVFTYDNSGNKSVVTMSQTEAAQAALKAWGTKNNVRKGAAVHAAMRRALLWRREIKQDPETKEWKVTKDNFSNTSYYMALTSTEQMYERGDKKYQYGTDPSTGQPLKMNEDQWNSIYKHLDIIVPTGNYTDSENTETGTGDTYNPPDTVTTPEPTPTIAGPKVTLTLKGNGGIIDGGYTEKKIEVAKGVELVLPDAEKEDEIFWGWSGTNYTTTDKKLKAYNDGNIFLTYTPTITRALYAIFDKQDPDDIECDHTWRNLTETCPDCGLTYVYARKCTKCGEEEELYHDCPGPITIIYKPEACHCHNAPPTGKETTLTYNRQYFVIGTSNPFTLFAHEIYAWEDQYGHIYENDYNYKFDDEGGRLPAGSTLELRPLWRERTSVTYFDYNESAVYDPTSMTKGITSKSVMYGTTYDPLPIPSCYGYIFDGWFHPRYNRVIDNTDVNPSYDDVTLTAKWRGKPHHYIIDLKRPITTDEDAMCFMDGRTYNAVYGKPFNYDSCDLGLEPFIPGYEFLGFYLDGTNIRLTPETIFAFDADVTVVGKWKVKEYTYDFELEGGTYDGNLSLHLEYGKPFSGLPDGTKISKDGYDFGGWYTAPNGRGTKYENGDTNTYSKNGKLYAHWIPRGYTITFDYCLNWKLPAVNAAGTEVTTKAVSFGEAVGELPTPTREGYTFVCWVKDFVNDPEHGNAVIGKERIVEETADNIKTNKVTSNTKYDVAGDCTLYAVWKPLTFYITYDYNYDYTETIPLPEVE